MSPRFSTFSVVALSSFPLSSFSSSTTTRSRQYETSVGINVESGDNNTWRLHETATHPETRPVEAVEKKLALLDLYCDVTRSGWFCLRCRRITGDDVWTKHCHFVLGMLLSSAISFRLVRKDRSRFRHPGTRKKSCLRALFSRYCI